MKKLEETVFPPFFIHALLCYNLYGFTKGGIFMNIRKGVSYVAFGFLFVLMNFNLNFGHTTINVCPDFVGWILFYLAFDLLGDYISSKSYMKILSLVMVILTGALWVLELVKPGFDTTVIKAISNLINVFYMFILFGVLENIATDFNSTKTGTIRFLKYFNLFSCICLVVASFLVNRMNSVYLASFVIILGVLVIVAAIVTLVTLFGLRKEINEKAA